MSLFVCSSCGHIENTALSHFWLNNQDLCAGCDPELGDEHTVGQPLVARMRKEQPALPYKGQELVRTNDDGEVEYYVYGE